MRETVLLGLLAASVLTFGAAQQTGGAGQTGGGQTGGGAASGGASGSDSVATEPGVAAQTATGSGLLMIEARNPGSYLADPEGNTLYTLVDEGGQPLPCEADCLTAWPPYTGEAALDEAAGSQLDASLVGTVDTAEGAQVTYNGLPLYTFTQDAQPGDLSGQGVEGFGGTWYIIGDDGEPLESDPLLETGS